MTLHPTLAVLTYSGLALLSAGFGAIPVAFRQRLPPSWLGWANAVAAGLMLGVAYILMAAGLPRTGMQCTPMTSRLNPTGKQFVVIAASGHGRLGTTLGDYLAAFALP